MPSKLRYVMYMPGETLRGSQAVAMLCKMMQKNLFQLELPKTWKKFRTRERLEWLSQFLPVQCKFVMIREPKWTRKNRSRYIKAVHSRDVDYNALINAKKMDMLQGQQFLMQQQPGAIGHIGGL